MNLQRMKSFLPIAGISGLFLQFLLADYFITPSGRAIWSIFCGLLMLSHPILKLFWDQWKIKEPSEFLAWGLGFLSYILYHVNNWLDDFVPAGMEAEVSNIPKVQNFILLVLILLASVFFVYTILLQLGRQSELAQSTLDSRKKHLIRSSVSSFFLVLLVVVGVNYVASQRDSSLDLSSSGKFSYGPVAKKILQAVDQDVQISAFYPRPLESSGPESSLALTQIRPDVEIYLNQLPGINPHFKIQFINADVEKDKLTDFGQVSNGTILVRTEKKFVSGSTESPYNQKKLMVQTPDDVANLEKKIVEAVAGVASEEKIVYFTDSNGERFSEVFRRLPNQKIDRFTSALTGLNFKVEALGFSNGWPGKIPDNADALAIIGPTTPFSQEQRDSILEYLQKKNGKLMITVEPNGQEHFEWLLSRSGLQWDEANLAVEGNPPGIIVANDPSDLSLWDAVIGKGRGVVFPHSGIITALNSKTESDWDAKTLLSSGGAAFQDPNHNGKLDPNEKRENFVLAQVLLPKSKEAPKDPKKQKPSEEKKQSLPEGFRVLIYSGTAWLTDQYSPFQANPDLAVASLSWLSRDSAISSIPKKEEKIDTVSLTDGQKKAVWVIGMFLFPGAIAGFTSWIASRKKNKRMVRN